MKKLLALVLAVAMLLSLSVVAFADTKYSDDLYDGNGNKAPDPLIPGTSYYYVIGPSSQYDSLLDTSLIRFSLKKKEGGKYIDTAELVEKKFTKEFDGHPAGRYVAIQITPKDNYSAEEYKSALVAEFKAKKDLVTTNLADVVNGAFPVFEAGTISSATPEDIVDAEQAVADAKKAAYGDGGTEANPTGGTADALTKAEQALGGKTDPAVSSTEKTDMEDAKSDYDAAKTELDRLNGLLTEANAAFPTNLQTELDKLDNLQQNATKAPSVIQAAEALKTSISNFTITEDPATFNTDTIGLFNTTYNLTDTEAAVSPLVQNEEQSKTNAIAKVDEFIAVQNKYTTDYDQTAQNEQTRLQGLKQAVTDAQTDYDTYKLDGYKTAAVDYYGGDGYSVDAPLATSKLGLYKKAVTDYAGLKQDVDDAEEAHNAALKEITTKENKLKALQSQGVSGVGALEAGDSLEVNFKIYIQNETIKDEEDGYFTIGEKGKVIKPVANEWNTVTWEDANRTLAYMEFYADSDTSYFYPKLSSKWNNEDYESYFDGMDAYMFNFVDNPTISATSRPSLYLYNPFVDEDGELYVDLDDLYVYQVVDGELKDVTSAVTFEENDDGDEVILIKTRTLGTYIVSEGEANIPEDEIPVDNDDPIIIDSNKKVIPYTGR